ncbi:MAG: cytochrome c biogenesis protein CcsA [Gemmatimonadota bacterium]
MTLLLLAAALTLYLAAAGLLAASFAGGRAAAPRGPLLVVVAGLAAHAAGLAAFTLQWNEPPLVGLGPSLATFAFLIGVFLVAALLVAEARPLALVLAPLIAVLLAAGLVVGVAPSGDAPAFQAPWFSLHVVLAFVGYAGLAVASAAGLLYVLQFRQLRDKHFGRAFRYFPPLSTLDGVGRRALVIGFPALTAAILLGAGWTLRFREVAVISEPKVVWAVATWFVFVGVLMARRGGAGSDRRGALASVIGFVLVVLAYLVVRLTMGTGSTFL